MCCNYSGVSFGFGWSKSLQMNLNSTNVASSNFDLKFLRDHFSAKFWAFSESETFSRNGKSWPFECVYPLPEILHQAFSDILGPPAVNQLYLMGQWCSQASGFNKSIEISQFWPQSFLTQRHLVGCWQWQNDGHTEWDGIRSSPSVQNFDQQMFLLRV